MRSRARNFSLLNRSLSALVLSKLQFFIDFLAVSARILTSVIFEMDNIALLRAIWVSEG